MSVNGIGAAGYPVTGYQTRRTGNNAAEKSFAGSMGNVKGTGNTGITLHISNEEDGQSIGAMADHDSSVTVYKTKDFDPANPVYKVKIWDAAGNVTERMVDISKVDPKNCDEIDMLHIPVIYLPQGNVLMHKVPLWGLSPTITVQMAVAACLIRKTGRILLRILCRCSTV